VDALDPKLATSLDESKRDSGVEKKDTVTTIPVETVQPVEVFPAQEEHVHRQSALGNTGTPVSLKVPESAIKDSRATPQPTPHTPRPYPGKVTRQVVSASDAKLTEVIKTALVGSKNLGEIDDRNLHQNPKREGGSLPTGKSSPRNSWSPEPNSDASFTASRIHIKRTDSPSEQDDDRDLEAKAIEVLKTLRDSGYIIQEPLRPQKTLNAGSAASSKSENLVICSTCSKFKGRPCELK